MRAFVLFLILGLIAGCDGTKKEEPMKTPVRQSEEVKKTEEVGQKSSVPAVENKQAEEKQAQSAPSATDKKESKVVTEKESKQTVELKIGEKVTIRLKANATTGYSWHLSIAAGGEKFVTLSEENYIAPGSQNPPIVGAPGVAEYTVTAKAPGKAVVSGIYYRSWEKPAPSDERVEYTINVQ